MMKLRMRCDPGILWLHVVGASTNYDEVGISRASSIGPCQEREEIVPLNSTQFKGIKRTNVGLHTSVVHEEFLFDLSMTDASFFSLPINQERTYAHAYTHFFPSCFVSFVVSMCFLKTILR